MGKTIYLTLSFHAIKIDRRTLKRQYLVRIYVYFLDVLLSNFNIIHFIIDFTRWLKIL